jgi:peptidylprolyl isomerase
MKYVTGGIVAAAAVIGIVVWLKGAPEMPVEPTTEAPALRVDEAPTTASVPKGEDSIKKPIKTTTMNGMTITTTKEGTGPAIAAGQKASMLYTGKLDDGTVFDSTSKRNNQPFVFTLGVGQVIKGWDQGVLGMKVGEERTLVIPADLAYGAGGIPGVIPGGATLTFDVTLLAIN